jgi:hypothetical protein
MEEFFKIIKEHFKGRFEIDKPVHYNEYTFLPIINIKDNLDNIRYKFQPQSASTDYTNFLIDELTKIVVEKREGTINYILNK